MALHISIAAETITKVGPLPVTNSLITTWIVMAILGIIAYLVNSKLKNKPNYFQVVIELLVGGLFTFFTNLGGKRGAVFAPLAVTIFLFVLLSNWLGLLPGVGTIGFFEEGGHEAAQKIVKLVNASAPIEHSVESKAAVNSENSEATHSQVINSTKTEEHKEENAKKEKKFVPMFRAPTADLNTTLALALIVVGSIQFFGFKYAGIGYLKKFFDIRSPIYFFVGILELVSDISKILSFAFRLFGNVFAGEVLLAVMAFLFAFFLPIPFYGLELFVGAIQALVFGMLTVVFTSIAVSHGDHAHDEKAHA